MRKFLKKSTALFVSLMLSIVCFSAVPMTGFADDPAPADVDIDYISDKMHYVDVANGKWNGIDLTNKKDTAELELRNPNLTLHETALFYDGLDRKRHTVSLLYPVDHIISVRSYDLKTEYFEGKDFTITDAGKIKLTKNTSIPIYGDDPDETEDLRCLKGNPGSYSTDWDASTTWRKMVWKYNIDVTYTHSETWGKDALYEKGIEDQSEKLSYFINKAKSGEKTNVLFLGSSIMEGYYATAFETDAYVYTDKDQRLGPTDQKTHHSSLSNFQSAGYTQEDLNRWGGDSFAQQIANALIHTYGDNISYVNRGVGSTTLPWTLNNKEFLAGPADPNCNPEGTPTPDLVIIYLGGNEATAGYSNYYPQLTELVTYLRTLNPNCNVIFCSSSFPNRYNANGKLECYTGGIGGQEQAAQDVADEMGGMIAVPVWSIFKSMIDDGNGGADYGGTKQVFDYQADMVNHPNDFGHTVWAKAVLQAIGLENVAPTEDTPVNHSVSVSGELSGLSGNLSVDFNETTGVENIIGAEVNIFFEDGTIVGEPVINPELKNDWEIVCRDNKYLLMNKYENTGNEVTLEELATKTDGKYNLFTLPVTVTEDGEHTVNVKVIDIATASGTPNEGSLPVKYTFISRHVHSYPDEWMYDATNHRKECTCGEISLKAKHDPEVINIKEATQSEDGYTGDTVCKICGYEISKGEVIPSSSWTVSFTDKSGKVVYSCIVMDGETIEKTDIDEAGSKVRDVLGFVRVFDENGKQSWNNDVTGPIFANTVFAAAYSKDPYKYDVNITYSDNTTENRKQCFNDKITVVDDNAKSWYNNGKFYSENNIGGMKFYVGGPMSLTASDVVSTSPRISITGVFVGDNAYGNCLTTLAHLSNPQDRKVVSFGFNYISKTYYDLMSATDRAKDWKTVTGYGKTCVTSELTGTTRDFYTTLEGISTTSKATRYAQAYVTFSTGTTIVSDIEYRSFNDIEDDEEGYIETTVDDTIDEE